MDREKDSALQEFSRLETWDLRFYAWSPYRFTI